MNGEANTGSVIVNLIIIVFIFGFSIRGLVKGFAKTFISLFGTIISLVLAMLVCPSVTNFLENQYNFVTDISLSVEGFLNKLLGAEMMNMTLESASDGALGSTGLGGIITYVVLLFKNDVDIPPDIPLKQILCPTFAYYISMIISVAVLFVLFKICLFIIGEIIKKLYVFSPIKHFDRILGLLLGFIASVIYLEVVILLLNAIPLGFVQRLNAIIQTSSIATVISDFGLLGKILGLMSTGNIVSFVKQIILK